MLQTTDPYTITTQIDSLHTQVQIIDTTVTHVHVYDTIVTHVYDTIQPDLITVYEKVIASQDSRFVMILSLIAVFVTLLVVGFAWFNIDVAKKLFRREFENIIEEEKPKIKADTLKALDKDLSYMKAESARLFALSCGDDEVNIANKVFWWLDSFDYYTKSEKPKMQKLCISNVLNSLIESNKKKDIFCKFFKSCEYDFGYFRSKVDIIHDIVSEKEQIIKLLDELEEHYNKVEALTKEAEVAQ